MAMGPGRHRHYLWTVFCSLSDRCKCSEYYKIIRIEKTAPIWIIGYRFFRLKNTTCKSECLTMSSETSSSEYQLDGELEWAMATLVFQNCGRYRQEGPAYTYLHECVLALNMSMSRIKEYPNWMFLFFCWIWKRVGGEDDDGILSSLYHLNIFTYLISGHRTRAATSRAESKNGS